MYLAKTKLTEEDVLTISDYNVYRKDRVAGRNGGVLITPGCGVKVMNVENIRATQKW